MADAGGKGRAGGFLGSLKDALAAASRDDTGLKAQALAAQGGQLGQPAQPAQVGMPQAPTPNLPVVAATSAEADHPAPPPLPVQPLQMAAADPGDTPAPKPLSAAEAARAARGVTSLQAPNLQDRHMEFEGTNTTRIIRGGAAANKTPAAQAQSEPDGPARTQLVRGRQPLKRGQFVQDPVVGWLVIVGGPGLGAFRPIFEGNNTIGRSANNRIPLDYGDDSISSDEQAYLRYDGTDRTFLFVPNLAKTNVVSVNAKKPTAAIELAAMDVIVMGRTQLVFMPFCGPEFDWSEISESKE